MKRIPLTSYTKMTAAFSLCCALALAPQAAQSQTNQIVFSVDVDADKEGTILCGLYDDEDTSLSRDVAAGARVEANGSATLECVFDDIKPGIYAIAAIHDEDDDEKMDRVLGVPQEGYTTSRNAHEKGIYPDWEDAYFEYQGGRAELSGSMEY